MFQMDKQKYDVLFYLVLVAVIFLGVIWLFDLAPTSRLSAVQGTLLFLGGKIAGLLFNSKGE